MTVAGQMSTTNKETTLAIQTRQLSEHYPELYEHLKRRDRAIERALARVPSRADVELASVFNARSYLEKTMRELAPGVGDLNGFAIQDSDPDIARAQGDAPRRLP